MSPKELESRFLIVKKLVLEAGIMAKSMKDRGGLRVRQKQDGSMVTNADEKINRFLSDSIGKAFKGETVVGEEDTETMYPGDPSAVWFVDPIDGTSGYIHGSRDYYVLVGFCVDGIPVLGLHYHPESGELVYGYQGQKAHIIKPKMKPQPIYDTARWENQPRIYIKTKDRDLAERVLDYGVSKAAYAKGMVDMIAPLFGKANGYVSYRPTHYWDLAAGAAIMRSAGFVVSELTLNGTNAPFTEGLRSRKDFFFALPKNTPDEFIHFLEKLNDHRLPLK